MNFLVPHDSELSVIYLHIKYFNKINIFTVSAMSKNKIASDLSRQLFNEISMPTQLRTLESVIPCLLLYTLCDFSRSG